MNKKSVLIATLLLISAAVLAGQFASTVRAEDETPQSSSDPYLAGWFVDANGTVFQITNSRYLNVTLTSSEHVHVFLESVPCTVNYAIENLSSASSTTLTLSGFMSNTTYYRYQDGNFTENFTTDSTGAYAYVQDIFSPHHIFITEDMATVYIRPNGSIIPTTAPIQRVGNVYTLTHDIHDTIILQRNNIVLDGAGYRVQPSLFGGDYGIYLSGRNNITIKNVEVRSFGIGIYVVFSSYIGVSGNDLTNNEHRGITFGSSSHCSVSGNIIVGSIMGVQLSSSDYNSVCENSVANGYYGVYFYSSGYNSVSRNDIASDTIGVYLSAAHNNNIYHNNFIQNAQHVGGSGPANAWDDGYPSGGNYWSDYIGVDSNQGPNQDQAGSDEIGDTPYAKWGIVDHYPFMRRNGWLKYLAVQTNPLGIAAVQGEGLYNVGTSVALDAPTIVPVSTSLQYRFSHWTVDGNATGGNPIIVYMGANHTATANYITQYYLSVQIQPASVTTIPGEGWYNSCTVVDLEAPSMVTGHAGVQCVFDHWAVDGSIFSDNPLLVNMTSAHSVTGVYITQYYLTVLSPYDTAGGEGWYNADETAYATLQVGLAYDDSLAYGFVGWSGDASGWDLLSDPILMNGPRAAIANWESSQAYGDVRTIGFWKHQINVWYFTELANTGIRIRGIGTPQISETALINYLAFIDANSDYFRGKIVKDNNGDGTITNLEILENAYNTMKTPTGPDSMKMRAEQQLLAVWLNLAHNAFYWNTQLSQDTLYVYYQHNFENEYGLTTIGEAIQFCEAQLANPNGNYEAAKNICDSINNNLGIIWGT